MTEETLDPDVAIAASQEARRLQLIAEVKAGEGAQEKFNEARLVYKKAMIAEEKRRKAADKKIKDLAKSMDKAHYPIQDANEARQLLMAEFVDRELLTARDRASATSTTLRLDFERARTNRVNHQAVIKRKSERSIEGVLRDGRGDIRRAAPKPGELVGEPIRGLVPNPNYWRSEEDKDNADKVTKHLELLETEHLSKLERAMEAYNKAQEALDAAIAKAFYVEEA